MPKLSKFDDEGNPRSVTLTRQDAFRYAKAVGYLGPIDGATAYIMGARDRKGRLMPKGTQGSMDRWHKVLGLVAKDLGNPYLNAQTLPLFGNELQGLMQKTDPQAMKLYGEVGHNAWNKKWQKFGDIAPMLYVAAATGGTMAGLGAGAGTGAAAGSSGLTEGAVLASEAGFVPGSFELGLGAGSTATEGLALADIAAGVGTGAGTVASTLPGTMPPPTPPPGPTFPSLPPAPPGLPGGDGGMTDVPTFPDTDFPDTDTPLPDTDTPLPDAPGPDTTGPNTDLPVDPNPNTDLPVDPNPPADPGSGDTGIPQPPMSDVPQIPGVEDGIPQWLKDLLGSTGAKQIFGGLLQYLGSAQHTKALTDAMIAADPFRSQRPFYQQQLHSLWTDPKFMQKNAGFQAGMDSVNRRNAKLGQMFSGNNVADVTKYAMGQQMNMSNTLGHLAGAGFGPQAAAELAGQAANSQKGQWGAAGTVANGVWDVLKDWKVI